jgi:hypothetical protein
MKSYRWLIISGAGEIVGISPTHQEAEIAKEDCGKVYGKCRIIIGK